MDPVFADQMPLRLGSKPEFACVSGALRAARFDEETICREFSLKHMSDIGSINANDVAAANISSQLNVLTRLFLIPARVPRAEVAAAFDQATVASFVSLGLLGSGEFGNDEYYSRALLYPVAGFLIASDRYSLPDESSFDAPADIVFPAIFSGTLRFLQLLPENWNGAALDLCSGTGIGALVLGRSGRPTVSADVTERAAAFARFNCALNGIADVDVVRGDLYEAVKGRTFGCIVAHPPYVPSVEAKAIWRDGGATGETLVRRIIEGLPEHLDAGGIFLSVSMGVDTVQAKFEARVRNWLGDCADQFDVMFACQELREPQEVLDNLARRYKEFDPQLVAKVGSALERAGAVKMPFGALSIRRTKGPAQPSRWTSRKRLSAATDGADLQGAFAVHERLSEPDFLATLEQSAPRLAPRLEVKVTHIVRDGSLVPADYLFEIDKPFIAHARFEAWMVPLLARLDGRTKLAEIYEDARATGDVPEDFQLQNLAVLVARTIEMGYTTVS
jgi:hypothetical protein